MMKRHAGITSRRLGLTRGQILAYRRSVGALDVRLPPGRRSLRLAAWAGLQDSVARAALLSIHARVDETRPTAWEDRSLVQIWGPRHNVYVVSADDLGVFTLGLLPDDPKKRRDAEDIAARLQAFLGDALMPYSEAAAAIGEHHFRLRYAAPAGSVLIRWDGAREPTVWCVRPPAIDPSDARLELARRYLHVLGPATPAAFAGWAGITRGKATAAFEALGTELIAVRTPIGEGFVLARDEAVFRESSGTAAAARFLPSGDAYLLAADRELLVADGDRRRALWPPATVWPGGLLVEGELVGTWRRASQKLTISPWRRLSRAMRDAVEAEAAGLGVPGVSRPIAVRWDD
jgi:hypothetical protein